jgi:hypothetical protein
MKGFVLIDDAHLDPSYVDKVIRSSKAKLLIGCRELEFGSIGGDFAELYREAVELNAVDIADSVIKKYTDNFIAKGLMVKKEIKELIETLKPFKENLWLLTWALDACKKMPVNEEEVYESIYKNIENWMRVVLKNDYRVENSNSVLLPLAAFYQYDIPMNQDFLIKIGAIAEDIDKLANANEIARAAVPRKGLMLSLHHSSLAVLYLDAAEKYPHLGSVDEVKLFNKYTRGYPECIFDVAYGLGCKAYWGGNKTAEEYLKEIVKKENIDYFKIGIKETERDFTYIGIGIFFINKTDSEIGKEILRDTEEELKQKVRASEESVWLIGNEISRITVTDTEIAREIVRDTREDLKQKVKASEEGFYWVVGGISEIARVDAEIVKEIVIDTKEELKQKVKTSKEKIWQIGEGIFDIAEIDAGVGKEIARAVKGELKQKVKTSKDRIDITCWVISNITKADSEVGKEIVRAAREELRQTVKATNTNWYIGEGISRITEVDAEVGKLFVNITKQELKQRLKASESIHDIGNVISKITGADTEVGKEIVNNVKKELKQKVRVSKESVWEIGLGISYITEADAGIGKELLFSINKKKQKKVKEFIEGDMIPSVKRWITEDPKHKARYTSRLENLQKLIS